MQAAGAPVPQEAERPVDGEASGGQVLSLRGTRTGDFSKHFSDSRILHRHAREPHRVRHLQARRGRGATDPDNDPRQWLWGTLRSDGVLEASASSEVEWSRGVTDHGRACAQARYALNSCGVAELDLTGLDPSSLTDLFYCFSTCSALTTIYVDAGWELPSGASSYGCFYNCKALVGENGTAWDSSKTSATYMRIDRDGGVHHGEGL